MAHAETGSNSTGSNICVYNWELLLLIAEKEETISPNSLQQMSEICLKYPYHNAFSLCQKLGWNSERLRRDDLLKHCRFYYPPDYSPQTDIETLQSDCLLVQTEDCTPLTEQPYRITFEGEGVAADIRSHLSQAMKRWGKDARNKFPSYWQGQIMLTAQPDISPFYGRTAAELVIRQAGRKPLSLWEKTLLRFPFLPIV